MLQGSNLQRILIGALGITEGELQEAVQTVLLDGSPVDDLQSVFPEAGSTVALSAALPGLLGASLRKGGSYAGLRHSITHSPSHLSPTQVEGELRVRIYNLLCRQWGENFLARGVRVQASEVGGLLQDRFRQLQKGLYWIRKDGSAITLQELREWLGQRPEEELVCLRLD